MLLFTLYQTVYYYKLHITPFLPQFITSRILYDVPITIPRNFINIYDILNYSHPTNCKQWQPIPLKHQQCCTVHVLLKIKMMFQKLTRENVRFNKFTIYSINFFNSYQKPKFCFIRLWYFFLVSVIWTRATAVDLPASKYIYIFKPADSIVINILVFLSMLIPTEYSEDKHFQPRHIIRTWD